MATETQGEHSFPIEVLVSGEKIQGFTAGEDLTVGEPADISGDYEVSASSAGGDSFRGVVLYDVASGEPVALAADDCEVRIEVSESVTAGDELVPDGVGTFETVATSGASNGVAIAQDGAASGEVTEAYIFNVQGVEA